MNLFDHYAFRARLQPAFLALLPLAIGVFSWAQPGEKVLTTLWSLLGTTGFTFLLANLARNRGKQLEPALWRSWDGAPTTQLLRHAGPANQDLRARWHKHLSKLFDLQMPTAEAEERDPKNADSMYEAAVRLLISTTYDKTRFPFVYRDNVNYGFCRNLLGLKTIGITTASIGLLTCLGATSWVWSKSGTVAVTLICTVADFCFLFGWIFIIDSEWVKTPAVNYAQHLLQSTEELVKRQKTAGTRKKRED